MAGEAGRPRRRDARGTRIVRAQTAGAFHSRTIENRIAAANRAKARRFVLHCIDCPTAIDPKRMHFAAAKRTENSEERTGNGFKTP
jgi:hypothetical protein